MRREDSEMKSAKALKFRHRFQSGAQAFVTIGWDCKPRTKWRGQPERGGEYVEFMRHVLQTASNHFGGAIAYVAPGSLKPIIFKPEGKR
jgi:hypothetical protein